MTRILLLLTAMWAAFCAEAAPTHVTWTTSTHKISDTEGTIEWRAEMEPGWHIYGMNMPEIDGMPTYPTTFKINPVDGLVLDGEVTPSVAAEKHFDPVMNLELPWWDEPVTFTQKFKLDGIKGAHITGTIDYMACTEKACTQPRSEEFSVTFGDEANMAEPAADDIPKAEPASTSATAADSNDGWWAPVAAEFNNAVSVSTASSWWVIFGMGFVGGLLALLTPCVWPMIPMTLSFFLKSTKNRRKSIVSAIVYGVSIVVIFLVLGLAITVIFGASKLNDLATSAVFNLIFFALLVVFAISFFGAFEIKLPSKWADAMDNKAENTSGFLSIFFMAFTLVLVSFSCTGPIIGTLLVEAASDGNIVGPAVGMGGFALGLAVPFALFAVFPSFLQSMPKSGGWLNSVKVVLGFIELILSLKFLSVADLAYGWRLLDREVFVAVWIVLFVLLGMYLLGKLRFAHDSEQKHTSVLGFFLAVVSLSFAVYLVPGLWGAPLKSISAFAPPLSTQDFNLYGGEFREFSDFDEGMEYASKVGKPVMIDFTGYGCVNCRKMEMAVFDDPSVRTMLEDNFVLIKLYVDDKASLEAPFVATEDGKQVTLKTVGEKWSYLEYSKFGISTQPYYVLLDNTGQPVAPPMSFNENVSEVLAWFEEGLKNYNHNK